MKEYLERPELVSEHQKDEAEPPLKKYRIPVWISGVYDFIVEAPDAEGAWETVRFGEVAIDYDRLRKEVYWDFGAFEVADVEEITEVTK